MKLKLYHGSANIIEKPEFGLGNAKNDYGLGFYCTEHIELAKEWACADNRDGFANEYELEMDGLSVLNLSEAEYHILNWLAILLENRTFVIERGLPSAAKEYILSEFLPGVMDMYPTFHEADISKFVYSALKIMSKSETDVSPLKRQRKSAGFTQQELAERSGVSLRMIRAYEQNKQDISKAEAAAVLNLASVLGCSPYSLLR